MFKTAPDKTGRIHHGGGTGLRERDTDFPGAPAHVLDRAQALPLDINTIRQFSFAQHDRPSIPERPSTSGGPASTSDFPLRRDAWKRETRDDFDFPPPSMHGKHTTFYDFPLPGGLPTPDSAPEDFSPPARKSSLARSPTPESIEIGPEEAMEASAMAIGMAIGSPGHAPATWQPQVLASEYHPWPEPTEVSSPMPTKQKSKWKMFGGLFGGGAKKQNTAQAQNFYQLQAERTPTEQQPIRGWTTSEQHASDKKRPDATRANTAPIRFDMQLSGQETPEILVDGNRFDENAQPRENPRGMLDVDIPSVAMERYSVMFGSLLSGGQTTTTPSLLARRQATLDRLKVVNEELARKEQELEEKEKQIKHPRRATSPGLTRSPAFSLFPNTPSQDSRLGRAPSPNGRLVRSNTSPAALSPSRPSFAPGLDNEFHATLVEPGPHIPDPSHENDTSDSVAPKAKQKPDLTSIVKLAQAQAATDLRQQQLQQQNRNFTPEGSQFTLSPEADIYDVSPIYTRPSFSEQSRQIIPRYTPQTTTSSSSNSATSQSDHSTSSSISTTTSISHTSTIKPPARTPSPQSTNKALPIPMSKFTAPPQAHKTRNRSATTTTSANSSSPIAIPNSSRSIPRTPDISGPTNLSTTSPSLLSSSIPNSSSTRPVKVLKAEVQKAAEDEKEARLKSLAEVSIARQISVSRQQRQLLVPIKGSFRGRGSPVVIGDSSSNTTTTTQSPNPTTTTRPKMRARASTVSSSSPSAPSKIPSYNQNFPSPLQTMGGSGGINVSNVTSPLSAVERATREEWEISNNIISPSSSNNKNTTLPSPTGASSTNAIAGVKKARETQRERERLFAAVKPTLPTLVIVGGNDVAGWDGSASGKERGDGIAGRRRRARMERDAANGMGKGIGSVKGHEYKKSEKVVVERV